MTLILINCWHSTIIGENIQAVYASTDLDSRNEAIKQFYITIQKAHTHMKMGSVYCPSRILILVQIIDELNLDDENNKLLRESNDFKLVVEYLDKTTKAKQELDEMSKTERDNNYDPFKSYREA